MTLDRQRTAALLWSVFALGFYAAAFIFAVTLGDDRFNDLFPLPWRMFICIPALVSAVWGWIAIVRLP